MRLTDPVDGNGEVGIRKMLLAQRSLSTLGKVLMRKEMLTQLDMLRMFVKWKYQPAPQHRGMSIAGIPPHEIGRGEFEGWGFGTKRILRPDELAMREGVRRNLDLDKKYLDMMLWGFVDKKTLEDIWPTETAIEEGQSADTSELGEEPEENGGDDEQPMDYAAFSLD